MVLGEFVRSLEIWSSKKRFALGFVHRHGVTLVCEHTKPRMQSLHPSFLVHKRSILAAPR